MQDWSALPPLSVLMLAKPPLLLMLAARPAFRLAPPVMQLPPPSGMPPDQSASMQFMITNAMRAELLSLGYETHEINRMVPGSAAAIINQQVRSPRAARAPIESPGRPGKRAKLKTQTLMLKFWSLSGRSKIIFENWAQYGF